MADDANSYMAYSGSFEVDEATQTLTHHMDVSLNPTWLGQAQERFVKMDGNKVVIAAYINTALLTWRKFKKHDTKA